MVESHADKIAPVVAVQWAAAKARGDPETVGRKKPKAGFRAAVARKVYQELPVEEKAAIVEWAKTEAAQAKEEYKRVLENPLSNKPEDRQR
jgi:hypothetical protein